jgi:hypothetical protein
MRLTTRTSNDFGKSEHELAAILGWRVRVQDGDRRGGAVMIDATLPLEEVFDAVVRASTEPSLTPRGSPDGREGGERARR